eukprot:gene247-16_t
MASLRGMLRFHDPFVPAISATLGLAAGRSGGGVSPNSSATVPQGSARAERKCAKRVELENLPALPGEDEAGSMVSSAESESEKGVSAESERPSLLSRWLRAESSGILLGAFWLALKLAAQVVVILMCHGVLLGLELCTRSVRDIEASVLLFSPLPAGFETESDFAISYYAQSGAPSAAESSGRVVDKTLVYHACAAEASLVEGLSNSGEDSGGLSAHFRTLGTAPVLVGSMFVFLAVATLANTWHDVVMQRVGQRLKARTTMVVFEKVLTSAQGFDTGMALNLISSDSQRWIEAGPFAHYVWGGGVLFLLTGWFLYRLVGVHCLWTLIGIGLVIPSTFHVAHMVTKLRSKRVAIADKRMQFCTELLTGIRIVKYFVWEESYIAKILQLRDEELHLAFWQLQSAHTNSYKAVMLAAVGPFISLSLYASEHGGEIESSRAFGVLLMVSLCRMPFFQLGNATAMVAQCRDVAKRVEVFLAAEDFAAVPINGPVHGAVDAAGGPVDAAGGPVDGGLSPAATGGSGNGVRSLADVDVQLSSAAARPAAVQGETGRPVFSIRGADIGWWGGGVDGDGSGGSVDVGESGGEEVSVRGSADNVVLRNVWLDFRRNQIVFLTGRLGSGKTTLLCSLLGEAKARPRGAMQVSAVENRGAGGEDRRPGRRPTISYVSQSAWIRSASLRDNILFFREFCAVKYERAIRIACLASDLDQLKELGGDRTEIGERGVTLSGGQKMRLALARAVYDFEETDVFLFDDIFAALDPRTGRKVAHRLLELHQPHQLFVFTTNKKVDFAASTDPKKVTILKITPQQE